jgi:glycosyltransferase involved in cell wall biosynthesis
MQILFIHQNFPGQFVHVARALAAEGHAVHALGLRAPPCAVPGVQYQRYPLSPPASPSGSPLLQDLEVKIARASACAAAMQALHDQDVRPDVIVAHPGWGEALFCKDVWPEARLLVFAEFFYSADSDAAFDPEFSRLDLPARQKLRMKNTVHLHALHAADAVYAPTQWQRQQLPAPHHARAQVVFDGIDTTTVRPDAQASLLLKRDGLRLRHGDEVLTFVARNLEPYRGFHVFMRALPALLAQRPQAHVLIVGGDEVSYGKPPAAGGTWRQAMLAEVGAQLPMSRVHFLGKIDYASYLRVLQVSACHVYLSYPFVLSWSCLEAMAAGCTLVASATPPVKEVITDGRNGLLFDFFDAQALASRAAAVLADSRSHRPLGEQARRTVIERYDLHSVCLPRQRALILGT